MVHGENDRAVAQSRYWAFIALIGRRWESQPHTNTRTCAHTQTRIQTNIPLLVHNVYFISFILELFGFNFFGSLDWFRKLVPRWKSCWIDPFLWPVCFHWLLGEHKESISSLYSSYRTQNMILGQIPPQACIGAKSLSLDSCLIWFLSDLFFSVVFIFVWSVWCFWISFGNCYAFFKVFGVCWSVFIIFRRFCYFW